MGDAAMAWSHGKHWTSDLIRQELQPVVAKMSRMPSANELRAIGMNDLACAIPRMGGYREWAESMGVQLKGTETHRGQKAEDDAVLLLQARGDSVVRQTTRAAYDLLVNGKKVDVKSATPSSYGKGKDKYLGWIFGLNKPIHICEYYMLMCLDTGGVLKRVYFVPSGVAPLSMLTITPNGKYEKYRSDLIL
jgi:hypothetical protein